MQTFKAKSAPYHYLPVDNKPRQYFELSKEKALLGLAFETGCLNLRGHRKSESLKRYGTFQCLIPACTGIDTLEHIMTGCQGYGIADYDDKGDILELIEYLYKLNRIRMERFTTSMINWKSGK